MARRAQRSAQRATSETRPSERMIVVRLPVHIEKRLEELAGRTGRSKSYYVREAILTHLNELEDLYLAVEVYARIRRGEERAIPLKDVCKPRAPLNRTG